MTPRTTSRSAAYRVALAVVPALVGSAAAPAQQQGAFPEQQPVFGANVELVLVDVAVLGDGGVPVTGLTAQDLVIEEDGEERQVGMVINAGGAPLDVALALDLSGSMTGTPWRQRAAEFLAQLDPRRDCVYLMGFSAAVGGSLWARPDHPALVESLALSQAVGGTALFDATVYAANQLAAASGTDLTGLLAAWEASLEEAPRSGPPPPIRAGPCPTPPDPSAAIDPSRRRRRALVMVTDGIDSGSRYREHHALLAAHAAGVPVFHVAVSPEGGPGLGGVFGRSGSSASFDRVVEETGGKRIRASAEAYFELLDHLRGYYVVGYYVPRPDPGVAAEIQRHELRIRLGDDVRDAEVLYPRVDYRPVVDRLRVQNEISLARAELARDELAGALFAAENAVAADPASGPARAVHAEVLERLERGEDAAQQALAAADLAPGDAAAHLLAARLALARDLWEQAWQQAILAAQAGADVEAVFDLFDVLARSAPMPDDFLERFEAPRVALLVGPSLENDVYARAALGKAMTAVGRSLAAAPLLALTRTREGADYIVQVSDKSVDEEPPRRFRGQITVLRADGKEIYDDDFTLDDLDDRERSLRDLEEHARDIRERIDRERRRR